MSQLNDKEIKYIQNIDNIDLLDLLHKETLSIDFIVNYILNEKYQKTRKEKAITVETVINYQPHFYNYIVSSENSSDNSDNSSNT